MLLLRRLMLPVTNILRIHTSGNWTVAQTLSKELLRKLLRNAFIRHTFKKWVGLSMKQQSQASLSPLSTVLCITVDIVTMLKVSAYIWGLCAFFFSFLSLTFDQAKSIKLLFMVMCTRILSPPRWGRTEGTHTCFMTDIRPVSQLDELLLFPPGKSATWTTFILKNAVKHQTRPFNKN